jgi:hypothetical protein
MQLTLGQAVETGWREQADPFQGDLYGQALSDAAGRCYEKFGKHYAYNNINYAGLAEWCKQRRGYIQVCENVGASWLPLQAFSLVNTTRRRRFSAEAIVRVRQRPDSCSLFDRSKRE